jgi:hypothetical protein
MTVLDKYPKSIDVYRAAAAKQSSAEFVAAHPHPFIVFAPNDAWGPALAIANTPAQPDSKPSRTAAALYIAPTTNVVYVAAVKTAGGDPIVVGRDTTSDIILPLPSISTQQCTLRPPPAANEPWTCSDAGSKNGSFIDDQRLIPGTDYDLRPGARLDLGGDLEGHFVDAAELWQLARDAKRLAKLLAE